MSTVTPLGPSEVVHLTPVCRHSRRTLVSYLSGGERRGWFPPPSPCPHCTGTVVEAWMLWCVHNKLVIYASVPVEGHGDSRVSFLFVMENAFNTLTDIIENPDYYTNGIPEP